MKKPKVGYLPFFIKLYDDSDPNYRDPLVEYMHKLVAMIESRGIEVIVADEICRVKAEFDRAAKKFNDAEVDAVITQHLAYSPSLESIGALLSLKAPIIVFDTTVDCGIIKQANYKNCMRANHGIHGVQDMCNLLKQNDKSYYLCVGHAMHGEVVSEVEKAAKAAAIKKAFQTARVGSVGGAFTGMGDFVISDERYKNDIGAQVTYMTPELAKKYSSTVTEGEIDAEISSDSKKYNNEITFEKEYREATRSGLALRKWMEDEALDSCTVNFLTLDISGLAKMPFIECCKILERGQGYAGEGDVLTAGLAGAVMTVYPNTTFTEMFLPDWEEDIILLSHMGEINPNLTQWKPLLTDKPFNYNSCGNTVSMAGCYRPGNAVYINLAPMKDHFHFILTEAELVGAGLEHGVYRRANQGWLKPKKPLNKFLKEFSIHGGTHHSVMAYDADIGTLAIFGEMMGFEVIII